MELQQVQSARLSQRQLYSVELLRLSTAELDVRIRELAQENPVIDLEEAGPEPQETVPEEFVDRLRWLEDNDSQNWFYQQVSDAEMDPLARVGTDGGLEETLTGFLSRQLDRLSIERDTRRLVEYLIRCLDDDGYLCLPGFGQVLGPDQNPIYLGTDKINCDKQGQIFYNEGGLIGRLGIYSFEDNGALVHTDRGLFQGENAELSQDSEVWWSYLERSNSDVVKQMTEMITYQRALQSAAQISKMYDQLMSRAATDVGRMQ